MKTLSVAGHAYQATASIHENVQAISAALQQAATAGARVLVTCECALTGYPGAARENLSDLSPCAIAEAEDLLHMRAQQLGIALILGTASPWQGGMSNDLFACGAVDEIQRYRKCFLTPFDAQHFSPGKEVKNCVIDGWRLGLSICFDVRFPRHWQQMAHQECDLFINSSHMAGADEGGIKAQIIPALYQSRATEWVTPLLLVNSAAPDRWLASGAWDARGIAVAQCEQGLFTHEFTPRSELKPWYHHLRNLALD